MSDLTTRYRPLVLLVCMVALCAFPIRILIDGYTPGSGFLGLLYFGQEFENSLLPEVRELSPVVSSQWGYDGQFYAQLALHPTLQDDALVQALDYPIIRSRRIGLPFLAFCLGLGRTTWILQIYALLNFGFWLLLLVAIIRCVGHHRLRDFLLAIALLWSTGTLTSVTRALLDLPAAVLGVLAVFSGSRWIVASVLLAAAGLVRETSILSFPAVALRKSPRGYDVKRLLMSTLIMMLPMGLWYVYVHVRLPSGTTIVARDLAFPLSGIVYKLSNSFHSVATGWAGASISQRVTLLFEVLCPLSLMIQALYLTAKPRLSSTAWRYGIGFVILLCFLGQRMWQEQYAYCRALLPLTFSFNLVIHKHESGTRFVTWYLLGNVGMCWLVLRLLL